MLIQDIMTIITIDNKENSFWDSNSENLLSLPFDQYQRYKLVYDIINSFRKEQNSFRILEVGAGIEENLKKFLPYDEIFYIDKSFPPEYAQRGDIIVGDVLETEINEQFDFVVAIDVYEHIPEIFREKFIDILLRLSRKATVLAAPFDQDAVGIFESFSNQVYKTSHGPDHIWLNEHIFHGLPSLDQTQSLIKKYHRNSVVIPNGYLPRWFEMMSIILLTEEKSNILPMVSILNEFYNKNFYQYDNRNPAYRQVIVITQKDDNLDFSKFLAMEIESEDLFNKKIMLKSLIKKIESTYQNEIVRSFQIQIEQLIEKRFSEVGEEISVINSNLFQIKNEINSLKCSSSFKIFLKFQNVIIDPLLSFYKKIRIIR